MIELTKSFLDEITYAVNGVAIEVHKSLGPGLLESLYHQCMQYELKHQGIEFKSELVVPIHYKGIKMESMLRCDFFVEGCLVVELKAHDSILPIHEAQVMTYMKLLKAPKGVIYNFNVINLYHDGQKTYVNEFFRDLPE